MATAGFDLKGMRNLFSLSDFMVAGLLIIIIALMLVPLPSFILVILLTASIAFSLILLLVAMYLKEPTGISLKVELPYRIHLLFMTLMVIAVGLLPWLVVGLL